jgi:hypothetical protein
MNKAFIYAIILFILGHTLAWYGSNLQFISEWWKQRSLLICCMIAIPTSLIWYFGTRSAIMDNAFCWVLCFLYYLPSINLVSPRRIPVHTKNHTLFTIGIYNSYDSNWNEIINRHSTA